MPESLPVSGQARDKRAGGGVDRHHGWKARRRRGQDGADSRRAAAAADAPAARWAADATRSAGAGRAPPDRADLAIRVARYRTREDERRAAGWSSCPRGCARNLAGTLFVRATASRNMMFLQAVCVACRRSSAG